MKPKKPRAALCAFMVLLCAHPHASLANETPPQEALAAAEKSETAPVKRPGFFALPSRQNAHAAKPQQASFHSLKSVTVQQKRASAKPKQEAAKTASLSDMDAHKLLLYVYDEVR